MKIVQPLLVLILVNTFGGTCIADDVGLLQRTKDLEERVSKLEERITKLKKRTIYGFSTIAPVVYTGDFGNPPGEYFATLDGKTYDIDVGIPVDYRIVGCGYAAIDGLSDLRCLAKVVVSPNGNKIRLQVTSNTIINRWWRFSDGQHQPNEADPFFSLLQPIEKGRIRVQIWFVYTFEKDTFETE